MELRYDNDDLMTPNQNWNGNWTDFNQELQQRPATGGESCIPVSSVEDRIMPSNPIHGCNTRYNYFLARNQIIGGISTYFNQGQQQSCANLQVCVSTSSALVSPPTSEDIKTPNNQNQDINKYINQEQHQRCVNLQGDRSNSCALVSPPTVEDTRTSGIQSQEDNEYILQEQQQRSGNAQGAEDDFIPLLAEYAVEEEYKLYVGGISNDTDEQNLKAYFTKYGEVKRVLVKRNRSIRKPWSFAFVTFRSKASVDSAMASTPHIIDGRKVSVGRTGQRKFPAIPRIVELKKARMSIGMRSKRIHVGGIKSTMTDAEILNYFEKFGKVEKLDHPVDKKTHLPKNFCLVTFENEVTVQQVCRKFVHKIGGQKCRVKLVRDKLDLNRRTPSGSMDYSESTAQLHGKAINRIGVTDGQSTGRKNPMPAEDKAKKGVLGQQTGQQKGQLSVIAEVFEVSFPH